MQTHPPPHTKREYLARTIADGLGDAEHLGLYRQCLKKYPLAIVYRAFAEAKGLPAEGIRKSRAALFFYLIKKYAHERKQNLGN